MSPELIMYLGFAMAAYSVIGNDVIQTLGTFLSSNENKPWYILWAFAGSILAVTLIYGWSINGGEVSFGRLIGDPPKYSMEDPKYPFVENMQWWYLLPPLMLVILTRIGIPVSTSFLILTFFQPKGLLGMVNKSLIGYGVAMGCGLIVYFLIAKSFEKKAIENPLKGNGLRNWTILQWCSTAFLWTQWLIQDFANIYVYLPRQIDFLTLIITLIGMLGLLAYIFYSKGGAIQGIVLSKTNTTDIRSATIIDFLFGILLYYFKELNNIPMSTTWVFLGLIGGREIAIRFLLARKEALVITKNTVGEDADISSETAVNPFNQVAVVVLKDLGKAFVGIVISVGLVAAIHYLQYGSLETIKWN